MTDGSCTSQPVGKNMITLIGSILLRLPVVCIKRQTCLKILSSYSPTFRETVKSATEAINGNHFKVKTVDFEKYQLQCKDIFYSEGEPPPFPVCITLI